MGKIVIFRNGQPHLDLVSRGNRTILSASQNKAILSDDSVTLRVASNSVLDIAVNDHFEVFGDFYRINQPPTVRKNSERSYEYAIVGQGLMFDLLRCKFFNTDGTGFKTTPDFPLIGNLQLFLTVIANNMKRFSPLWEIGNFPANTETKTINFSDDTCLSALQKICQEYKTEFWVKNEGGKYKIHTGQFGSALPIPFEYGKGKGLYSLSRNNVNEDGIINRLYVTGGSENIPADYRGFSDKLKFSNDGYLEDQALIAANGLKEGSIQFESIYPHRTGTVTAVGGLLKFTDASMDFDLNERDANGTKYLIAGQTAKIHFNKGNLAGYQFEVQKYEHATKTFTIIPFDNGNGQKFPDAGSAAFQFAVGDEYVILDIVMPQTYITNAESELKTKAQEQFALLKQAKVSYDLDIAEDYLAKLPKLPEIGDLLNIRDAALGIDKTIRVNTITRDFIDGGEVRNFRYKITIADDYEVALASQLVMQVKDIKTYTTQVQQQAVNLSRIGFNATKDLKEMVFDTDGYFDANNIKPGSIETGMLNVGAQSQQISTDLVLNVNYDGPNKVKADTFKVFSQTLNKEWELSAFETTLPDNAGAYVYAKVSKTGTTGNILIIGQKLAYGDDPNDYRILMGMLASVTDGVRLFVPTYGTTQIVGGMIRTGRISSQDGSTFLDLDAGAMDGHIIFRSGITTGTMVVGNDLGANAGLTGLGGNNDIFLWGGKDYQNRNTAPISLSRDGFMRVRNGAGQVIFEIGQKNGNAVFDIFNDNGVKVAGIGQSGIEFIGYTPEKFITLDLLFLSDQTPNGGPARRAEILNKSRTLIAQQGGGYLHTMTGGMTTAYQYLAGYNFNTPTNTQYEGVLFSGQNKLGPRVPNGLYAVNYKDYISQVSDVMFGVEIWRLENGVVTSRQVEQFSIPWVQMYIG